MVGLSEKDIRNRAYHLWKQAGEPAGAMDSLWYKAEADLLAERAKQDEVPTRDDGQSAGVMTGSGAVGPVSQQGRADA